MLASYMPGMLVKEGEHWDLAAGSIILVLPENKSSSAVQSYNFAHAAGSVNRRATKTQKWQCGPFLQLSTWCRIDYSCATKTQKCSAVHSYNSTRAAWSITLVPPKHKSGSTVHSYNPARAAGSIILVPLWNKSGSAVHSYNLAHAAGSVNRRGL
jgi:hypothetical protein